MYDFDNNARENSGWGTSKFQHLPKQRNPTSTQHNVSFSCSKDVKLSYQRQLFCQFRADETTEKATNTNCFTK